MTEALWGATLLWILIFIYAIAGSVDFGAGFWAMIFLREERANAGIIANRYLSPLWEVTNVFLVLFAVALVGLFPNAAEVFGTLLLVPGNLILVLLLVRTAFMVYAHTVATHQKSLRIVSGVTGLLIPALLMTVLPVSQGNLVVIDQGHPLLPLGNVFSSPDVYAYILFGIASELFISSIVLCDYARVAGDHSAFRIYRRLGLWLGPAAMVSALLTVATIPSGVGWLRVGLAHQWPLYALSGASFVVAMFLFWRSHDVSYKGYRIGVIAVALQYGLALFAYGRAHLPYMLYPSITIYNGFTNAAIFRAAIVVLIVGIAVLFPGFIWFWRLFLENRAYVAKS